jgi:hypothetical protein
MLNKSKRKMPSQCQPSSYATHKVILNLFNFVQFAYARHSSSKLDSALAQSQISGSHCEPSLTIFRGQMLKQVQHDIMIGTLALKNPNEFGISLTYSYLCQHEKDDSYLLRVLCGALFQGSDVPAMCA